MIKLTQKNNEIVLRGDDMLKVLIEINDISNVDTVLKKDKDKGHFNMLREVRYAKKNKNV